MFRSIISHSMDTSVFQNWQQAWEAALEIKDEELREKYFGVAKKLRNREALKQWNDILVSEYRKDSDYLVIVVGGHDAKDEIYPNFVRELAEQGKKISLINIDAHFLASEYKIPDLNLNVSSSFIPHYFDWTDDSWMGNINKFLRRGTQTVFTWHCCPRTYPYNLLKFYTNSKTLNPNTPLTYILGYAEGDPALIANINYTQQVLNDIHQNNYKNPASTINQFNSFAWGPIENFKNQQQLQKYSEAFGIIKSSIAEVKANEIITDRQVIESTLNSLKNEIQILKQNTQAAAQDPTQFLASLEDLESSIRQDINLQFSNDRNSKEISLSTSYKIAQETKAMLGNLRSIPHGKVDVQNYKLSVIRNYEKNCNNIKDFKLIKIIAVIVSAAIGFVLGAAIGATLGIFAGSWSGYGAAALSVVGLFKGAAYGTSLGLACGATMTGIGASVITCKNVFPRDPEVKRVVNSFN